MKMKNIGPGGRVAFFEGIYAFGGFTRFVGSSYSKRSERIGEASKSQPNSSSVWRVIRRFHAHFLAFVWHP